MKKLRIASGAGYAGDRIEPALANIVHGNVDYIVFECLAERTIALAQKDKLEDPSKGYNHLLEYRMEKVIPLLKDHPVKVITNMGAANPIAAAQKINEIALANNMPDLRIAAVVGDDILESIESYYGLDIMETGEKLETVKDKIISANAYIGGRAISEALAAGADIVVTGRVADPSLFTGPIMHEFGKSYDDYNFLGKTIVAGHLLECGGQVTGGYFADPGHKDVEALWDVPFPILTFNEDGSMAIEKLPNTGGLLNEATVKEQLLYEIQDPANYTTPDTVADFSNVAVRENGDGTVSILNATGKEKTGTLKVSVGYVDGYIGEAEISYGGHNCLPRARLAAEIITKRIELLGLPYREVRTDHIGVNSLYGDAALHFDANVPSEVRLRIAVRAQNEEHAAAIGREVEALYVNGPAGGGGVRKTTTKVVTVASVLVPEEDLNIAICWEGGKHETV
ncbi:DUF1446 domain-containing protein [Ruminococcaceae bacterium OttesenSCG-928-D13]|nr:DUF1446 domain-containing protein [Ruminococcaceae bacterium OttesenSCG-928-D13]